MNKILLIIQREYLSRVKKKSFLLVTFLVPLLFIGVYAGTIYLTTKSYEDTHAVVYVVDQQGEIGEQLESNRNITFTRSNAELQQQIEEIRGKNENVNVLIIPPDFYEHRKTEFLSSGKPNISTQSEIERQLSDIVRERQYLQMGVDSEKIRTLDSSVQVQTKEVTETGDTKESDTRVAMGIAIALSVLIYISLVLYGSQVMRGIIEEKSNRIIEVIISSVKPFQLMLGKIVGIGLVGLTQFLLWIILSTVLISVASNFMGAEEIASMSSTPGFQNTEQQIPSAMGGFQTALDSINFPELLISFFFFFLGGYLLYSALFAAVGSAVDSETEAGQFTMPITMPLLLAYLLSFGVLINDPHGPIALWLSFIPFTSPIAMLVRIPFGVPVWQIALSIGILIAGFVLTTWVAARIYRVGILMHGKKASIKELLKWFSYKG